jgi:predicted glycosyltransferase
VKPALLFYCQHAIGMGHLVRSLALAEALARRFRVVFLSGGRVPRGLPLPPDVELRALPPLGMDATGRLVSLDGRHSVERAQEIRRALIVAAYEEIEPAVVVVELFPFGRKKFAPELLPLLEHARQARQPKPLVVCSLRDILVGRPDDQREHDERAVRWANEYFDLVLIHADPRLARLEETFHPTTPLRVPVEYTGFVVGNGAMAAVHGCASRKEIVVSAGGGLVGEPLFQAALEAQPALWRSRHLSTRIVAGPFLPEDAWQRLRSVAEQRRELRLQRFVPNLRTTLRGAAGSVSQCGYNTALDLVWSGAPALVVPFEDEQMRRARTLEALGAVRVLPPECLDGPHLANAVCELLRFTPARVSLDLDGAERSARLLAERL